MESWSCFRNKPGAIAGSNHAAVPRHIQLSNEISFVLLIFSCQLFPSSENRFAALMPPNSAKLKDLDQASVLITVALCDVWQNWAMWMMTLRVQMIYGVLSGAQIGRILQLSF